jgi:hypothetical protein
MSDAMNDEHADPISPEQLHHIACAGFTERFMGGVREASPKGGYVWHNTATGERREAPVDVARNPPAMLALLDKFCAEQEHTTVWTMERGRDGRYACRIGMFSRANATVADLRGAASTPDLGLSVAIAMLQSISFDFRAAKVELYDNAPRILLAN